MRTARYRRSQRGGLKRRMRKRLMISPTLHHHIGLNEPQESAANNDVPRYETSELPKESFRLDPPRRHDPPNMDNVNNGKKPSYWYQCVACSRRYSSQWSLSEHLVDHHHVTGQNLGPLVSFCLERPRCCAYDDPTPTTTTTSSSCHRMESSCACCQQQNRHNSREDHPQMHSSNNSSIRCCPVALTGGNDAEVRGGCCLDNHHHRHHHQVDRHRTCIRSDASELHLRCQNAVSSPDAQLHRGYSSEQLDTTVRRYTETYDTFRAGMSRNMDGRGHCTHAFDHHATTATSHISGEPAYRPSQNQYQSNHEKHPMLDQMPARLPLPNHADNSMRAAPFNYRLSNDNTSRSAGSRSYPVQSDREIHNSSLITAGGNNSRPRTTLVPSSPAQSHIVTPSCSANAPQRASIKVEATPEVAYNDEVNVFASLMQPNFMQSSKRVSRTRFTPYQVDRLTHHYVINPYPRDEELEGIGKELDLSARVVSVWFQNYRQRVKRDPEKYGKILGGRAVPLTKRMANVYQDVADVLNLLIDEVCQDDDEDPELSYLDYIGLPNGPHSTLTSATEPHFTEVSGGHACRVPSDNEVQSRSTPDHYQTFGQMQSGGGHGVVSCFAKNPSGANGCFGDARQPMLCDEDSMTSNSNLTTDSDPVTTTPDKRRSSRPKQPRTVIDAVQSERLYTWFYQNPSPQKDDLDQIAFDVGLQKRVVQVWFQNARARERRSNPNLHSQDHSNSSTADDVRNVIGGVHHEKLESNTCHQTHVESQLITLRNDESSNTVSAQATLADRDTSTIDNVYRSNREHSMREHMAIIDSIAHREGTVKIAKLEPDMNHTEPSGMFHENDERELDGLELASKTDVRRVILGEDNSQPSTHRPRNSAYVSPDFNLAVANPDQKFIQPQDVIGQQYQNYDAMNDSTMRSQITSLLGSADYDGDTYHDESMHGDRQMVVSGRRYRTQMTPMQLMIMKAIFIAYKTPTMGECHQLGSEIGLQKRVVQVWFQNARAKEKKNPNHARKELETLPSIAPLLDEGSDVTQCSLCNIRYDGYNCNRRDHIYSVQHIRQLGACFRSEDLSNSPTSSDRRQDQLMMEVHVPTQYQPGSAISSELAHDHLQQHVSYNGHLSRGMESCNSRVSCSANPFPGQPRAAAGDSIGSTPRHISRSFDPAGYVGISPVLSIVSPRKRPADIKSMGQWLHHHRSSSNLHEVYNESPMRHGSQNTSDDNGRTLEQIISSGTDPPPPSSSSVSISRSIRDPNVVGTAMNELRIPPIALTQVVNMIRNNAPIAQYTNDCSSPSDLSHSGIHVKVVTTDVGYVCKPCERAWPQYQLCARHVRDTHFPPRKSNGSSESSVIGLDMVDADSFAVESKTSPYIMKMQQFVYECEMCNGEFKTTSDFFGHISAADSKCRVTNRSSNDSAINLDEPLVGPDVDPTS